MKAKERAFKHIEMLLDDVYQDGYNSGVEDAWELCRKLVLLPIDGGWSLDTIQKIYGKFEPGEGHLTILKYASARDALDCFKESLKSSD